MTTAAIREKLYDYLRIADDKKLKAIYWMLEEEISAETKWWKDNVFATELNKDFADWKSGDQKAFSPADIDKSIETLKKKRKSK
jgi:hypothetical protein